MAQYFTSNSFQIHCKPSQEGHMSHHLPMHIDSIRCDDHNIKAVMGLCISLHWSRLGGQKLAILSNVEARRPGEVVLTRMWSSLSAVLPSLLLHLHSFHPGALLSRFKLHPHHLHWLIKAYIHSNCATYASSAGFFYISWSWCIIFWTVKIFVTVLPLHCMKVFFPVDAHCHP